MVILLRPASIILGNILRRDHDLMVKRQLAVVKLRGGGSLLLALPALLSLRQRYPAQRFTLVTTPDVIPFAEMLGIFDDYAIVRSHGLMALLRTALVALGKVWRADGLINLEIHSRLATVFSCLSCARNRFGFYHETNAWQRDVITHLFFYNFTSPVYINYNQVAKALGAQVIPYGEVADYFNRVNSFRKHGSNNDGVQNVVLAPYCSELGKEREFADRHWAQVLSARFGPTATKLTLLGGAGDRERSAGLEQLLKETFQHWRVENLCGSTSLKEAAETICGADHFLTIDSGLNHIARLMGGEARMVSFWGPTDPSTRLAPFPGLNEEVVYRKLFCSPCVHVVADPPCKGNNICMRQYAESGLDTYSADGWMVISDNAVPRRV